MGAQQFGTFVGGPEENPEGMQKLASITLANAAASMSVGPFAARDVLDITVFIPSFSVNSFPKFQFGSGSGVDTGNNYSFRQSVEGAAYSTTLTGSVGAIDPILSVNTAFTGLQLYCRQFNVPAGASGDIRLGRWSSMYRTAADIVSVNCASRWAGANPITEVKALSNAGNFVAGSMLMVAGMDI